MMAVLKQEVTVSERERCSKYSVVFVSDNDDKIIH